MGNKLAQRMAKSLFKDLIIPWLISAVCVVVFFVIHVSLGMIGWPVCFLIFLFVCVLRDKSRKSSLERLDAEATNQANPADRAELMAELGIQFNGSYYTYMGYDYDKLEHAVSHAKFDSVSAKHV